MLQEAQRYKDTWQVAQRARVESSVAENAFVYAHFHADDDQPFYVGIGKNLSRPWDFLDRSDRHKNASTKHGIRVEIIIDSVSWETACFWEINWIKALRGEGYVLANMTDGGEGVTGDLIKGDNNHMRRPEYRDFSKNHFLAHFQTEKGLQDRAALKARMTANNPRHKPEVADKISGDNHWTRRKGVVTNFHAENNPSRKIENISRMVNNNPMKDPEIAEAVAKKNRGRKFSKESIEASANKRRGVPKTEYQKAASGAGLKKHWDSLTLEQRIARGKQMAAARQKNKLLNKGEL